MSRVSHGQNPGPKKKLLNIFLKAVAVTSITCLAVVGIGIGAYYGFIYDGKKDNNSQPLTAAEKEDEAKKQEVSKINQTIAVFGIDKDETRTDVIFVVNFNSQTNKIKVLALPRDTKVEWTDMQQAKLEEYGKGKVYTSKLNEMTAYGGMENIRDFTINQIENMLGVKIDNYVIINIDAFRKIVDTIGGVEVNVPRAMKYTDRAQDLHIDLQPGVQLLDGDKAEQLVRFRHYPNGDVDRIKVQQTFLKAFAEKVMSPQMITKIPQFISIMLGYVKTDVSLTEIGTYYPFLQSFNTNYLSFNTIPGEGRYENGISYFFPDTSAMDTLVNEVFFDTQVAGSEVTSGSGLGTTSSNLQTESAEPVIDKTVSIEVLNATGIKGVAGKTKDSLEKEGYEVSRIANYPQGNLDHTIIYAKDTKRAEQLKKYFKGAQVETNPSIQYDVQIVIGTDYAS